MCGIGLAPSAVVVRLRHLATVFGFSPELSGEDAGRLLRRLEFGSSFDKLRMRRAASCGLNLGDLLP